MNSGVWIVLLCIAIFIAIRLLARMDNIIGHIFKWYWNISFKIAAHVPLCGWMANFIISDGSELENKEKQHYVDTGKKADQLGVDYIQSKAAAPAVGNEFYGRYDGEYYEVISTYNHTALLRNKSTGETVEIYLHQASEGSFSDSSGNLYYPA